MIEAGQVAFLKTTGEAVFVLDVADLVAKVRRPVYAQTGNTHEIEDFFTVELESFAEQKAKVLAEQEEIQKRYAKFVPQAPATPDAGFGSN